MTKLKKTKIILNRKLLIVIIIIDSTSIHHLPLGSYYPQRTSIKVVRRNKDDQSNTLNLINFQRNNYVNKILSLLQ